eukprot:SAG22_NODE_212_length_15072_cov_3.109197_15_plen_278_part_00
MPLSISPNWYVSVLCVLDNAQAAEAAAKLRKKRQQQQQQQQQQRQAGGSRSGGGRNQSSRAGGGGGGGGGGGRRGATTTAGVQRLGRRNSVAARCCHSYATRLGQVYFVDQRGQALAERPAGVEPEDVIHHGFSPMYTFVLTVTGLDEQNRDEEKVLLAVPTQLLRGQTVQAGKLRVRDLLSGWCDILPSRMKAGGDGVYDSLSSIIALKYTEELVAAIEVANDDIFSEQRTGEHEQQIRIQSWGDLDSNPVNEQIAERCAELNLQAVGPPDAVAFF